MQLVLYVGCAIGFYQGVSPIPQLVLCVKVGTGSKSVLCKVVTMRPVEPARQPIDSFDCFDSFDLGCRWCSQLPLLVGLLSMFYTGVAGCIETHGRHGGA